MKILDLISVALVAFLVYIFTFYIDGEMGVILFAFLVFAPLVSLFFTIYGSKNISVSFDCDGYVKKGSQIPVKVTVRKNGVFPCAFVEVKPSVSEVFGKNLKTYRFSMFSEHEKSFTFNVDALIGGNGEISVDSVYSCGFLGFIRLRTKLPLPSAKSVGVIPEIPDIKASSQLFRAIADVVMTSDDDEENDTAMLFSANTTPGYEHREYMEGDPLKRINWKLSSKRSKLMVRLDEASASVQPMILLDLFRNGGNKIADAVADEEKLLMAVFGLLVLMVKQGMACSFAYRDSSGEMVTESIDNPDYPMQLLLKILSVKVIPDRRAVLPPESSSVCACIVATTDLADGFTSITDKIENHENASIIGLSRHSANPTDIPLWYLDDDNNFKKV